MILKKIYSEPQGAFKPVEFVNGVNFIYGKKIKDDPKKSLNSIGKSTFLDLIDFCLLSSFNKVHNRRLYKAKDILDGFEIVLEFQVDGSDYIIKRSVSEPNYAFFGKSSNDIEKYKIDNLKVKLGNLIFNRENYDGFFTGKWYRNLMLFYLKIQKHKKPKFLDPIKYIDSVTEVQHNVLQFYLLGFDDTIPNRIHEHRVREKGLDTTVKELKKFVEERYGLKDTKETKNKIQKLKLEIKKFEKTIDNFKLGAQYENAEEEADKLTESIKNLIYKNHVDKDKIKSYKESLEAPDKLNMRRINSMYKELSEDFSIKVKKTLEDAQNFRKKIAASRKDFIGEEIEIIEKVIQERLELIQENENKRIKLFKFLATKEAITDLKEAYGMLSDKKSELSDLESSSKNLFELEIELNEIAHELAGLKVKAIEYLEKINSEITSFYEILTSIYSVIYTQFKDQSKFSITLNNKKKSIIEIDLEVPDMFGKGKNQGRTLVYDLAVLEYNILNTCCFPRFLIHDGIFDGVDKAHFVSVYDYINKLVEKGKQIQYFTTINEEGTLSKEKFGSTDNLSPEKIEEEAILVLSADDKLFGTNF